MDHLNRKRNKAQIKSNLVIVILECGRSFPVFCGTFFIINMIIITNDKERILGVRWNGGRLSAVASPTGNVKVCVYICVLDVLYWFLWGNTITLF